MMRYILLALCTVFVSFRQTHAAISINGTIPEYVKQCRSEDPAVIKCIKNSLNHIRPWLASGIPEIALPSVEPFRFDQLALSLSTGPNGYKIVLKDLEIFGTSNFTIEEVKLGTSTVPFTARLRIPSLRITARYTSSGVLIILPASGNGAFYADFHDIEARVTGLGIRQNGQKSKGQEEDVEYLKIKELLVDLDIKKVHMNVKKIFNNNRILTEATNLFLRENGGEVLRHMMPQLRRKISSMFAGIANKLLENVPIALFYV